MYLYLAAKICFHYGIRKHYTITLGFCDPMTQINFMWASEYKEM